MNEKWSDGENGDLTELAKAVGCADVTVGDLKKAARTALEWLTEILNDPELGRTPTGARQLATVFGIIWDKLDKKLGESMDELSRTALVSMSDEELDARIIELSMKMGDEFWDRMVEAREKWKAGGGNGDDDGKASKERKKARHWYEKRSWEFEV